MDEEVIKKAQAVALDAAREAGGILRGGFASDIWVKAKSQGDVVTEIDFKAEEAVLKIIRQAFPDHAILAEESGRSDKDSDYMWVVDPLDGTSNYSIHSPFFDTSISLAYKKETVLGVTLVPMTGELFRAVKGHGAWLEPIRGGDPVRLRVSTEEDISKNLITFCNGSSGKDKEEIARIFCDLKTRAGDFDRFKAGALEIAYVAAGRLGAYLANSQMSWDSSAGALMVREAGGRVTDFAGEEWNVDSKDILATNGLIHAEMLQVLKRIRDSG